MSKVTGAFRKRVLDEVRSLQPGEVVSYGEIAHRAGAPNAARAVGGVLASNTEEGVPWWLVVTTDGRLVEGLEIEQTLLLFEDGVGVIRGRVPRALIVTPH